MSGLQSLPDDLPVPDDDGACDHLEGMKLPELRLPSTQGCRVRLSTLGEKKRTVIYCYPRTGRPGEALPDGWDAIPGARGCTPQACAFRNHAADLEALGAEVLGLSTQDTAYQLELTERLHLPFAILSDAKFKLTDALRLPTFKVDGMRLIKRLTLVVRDGRIEHVFYPVFPPDSSAEQVIAWLSERAKDRQEPSIRSARS